MLVGPWKDALIDISVSTTLSSAVDLGGEYEFLAVHIPTITSSTVTITVGESSTGTFYPAYQLDADATGDLAQITAAATTAHALVFQIGGARFIKILCGSTQTTTDKTFRVRGYG